MTQQLSTNTFGCAKFIVSSDATQGSHTTIAAALTSASSGDTIFIRPGTYTENLTLKAGVNLAALECDALTPNVSIVGKATATFAGTCSISGIRLTTNSDNLLVVSGSSATIVNLINCYLNISNNTGISYSSSSSSSAIYLNYCMGNVGTTGISIYSMSSAGALNINFCFITNSGNSLTASSNSAGSVNIHNCVLFSNFSTSSTGVILLEHCSAEMTGLNTTFLTTAGTGNSAIRYCRISTGTASSVSIGNGSSVQTDNTCYASSNTNVLTGAGTLQYSDITFLGSSSGINTTTLSSLITSDGISVSKLQPCFAVTTSAPVANATGDGTNYTVVWNSAVFDQASNFNTGTGTFTAPVTGKYLLAYQVNVTGMGAAHTSGYSYITTTARAQTFAAGNPASAAAFGNYSFVGCGIFSMTAGDTATVTVVVTGGTKTVGVDQTGNMYFSGQLIT